MESWTGCRPGGKCACRIQIAPGHRGGLICGSHELCCGKSSVPSVLRPATKAGKSDAPGRFEFRTSRFEVCHLSFLFNNLSDGCDRSIRCDRTAKPLLTADLVEDAQTISVYQNRYGYSRMSLICSH